MITIEKLNAIPGRPVYLRSWDGPHHWACCGDAFICGSWNEVEIAVSAIGNFYFHPFNVTPAQLLEVATYACKVEEEIEKWKSQSNS